VAVESVNCNLVTVLLLTTILCPKFTAGRMHVRQWISSLLVRDAVAAADDLQYMFTTLSSSSSSSNSEARPCKVLLKPRSFAGFATTTSSSASATTGTSTAVKIEVPLRI
jgi:hypothetical protein